MRALRRRDAAFVREQFAGPAMTPMVDVTLVILIFFMATASVAGREWLFPVSPQAAEERTEQPARDGLGIPAPIIELVLAIEAGHAVVSGAGLRSIPVEDAGGALAAVLEGVDTDALSFVLVPSDEVSYDAVVRTRAELSGLGIGEIGLR